MSEAVAQAGSGSTNGERALMHVTVRLEPMTVTKPRLAVEAAADVARRIGCCVSVAVNGVGITISPTTPKAQAFDAWNAAARAEGAQLPAGVTTAHRT